MRQKMSVMASAAAWGLGQWESMEEYVHSVPNNTMVYSLFQSVLHIHHGQFSEAQKVRKKEVGCLIVCILKPCLSSCQLCILCIFLLCLACHNITTCITYIPELMERSHPLI